MPPLKQGSTEKLVRILIENQDVSPAAIRNALRDPRISATEREELTHEFFGGELLTGAVPWQVQSSPDQKLSAESLGLGLYERHLSDPIEVREYQCPTCSTPMIQVNGSTNYQCPECGR